MPTDFATTLLIIISSALTFTVSRLLSRKWRERRRQRQEAEREAARRAGESRQVRRARERSGK